MMQVMYSWLDSCRHVRLLMWRFAVHVPAISTEISTQSAVLHHLYCCICVGSAPSNSQTFHNFRQFWTIFAQTSWHCQLSVDIYDVFMLWNKIYIFTKSTLMIDELDWLPTIIIIILTCKSAELCIFCLLILFIPEIMSIILFLTKMK